MAGRMRGGAVVLVTLLMLSTLPVFATADDADVRMESELVSQPNAAWYVSGEIVELVSSFVNGGASTTFENDPSCGAVLQVTNASGQIILDERTKCRGQSQMVDLASDETYDFAPLTWDLTDANGEEVRPGWYSVVAFHTATARTVAQEVHVQTNVSVPEALTLSITITSRLGPLVASDEMVLSALLYNPTPRPMTLPDLGGCLNQLTVNGAVSLTSPCMPSEIQIGAYEEILIEQTLLSAGTLLTGINSVAMSIPGQSLTASLTLDIAEPEVAFNPTLQDTLDVTLIGINDVLYGGRDIMQAAMNMRNVGPEVQSMRFTDTCRAELWVVNDQGDVVFDSRPLKSCNAINMDYILDSEEEVIFSLPDWTFTNMVGCQVASGHYTVIVEVPQFHLAAAQAVDYSQGFANNCEGPLDLDIIPSLVGVTNGFDLDLMLEPRSSEVELRWVGPCSVIVTIMALPSNEEIQEKVTACNNKGGRHLVLPYGPLAENLVLEGGEIRMFDLNNESLPDGTYQLVVTLESNPTTSAGFVFDWPILETVTAQPLAIVEELEPEASRLISGTWSGVLTEDGTCWILDSPQEGQLLLSRASLGSWAPQQGLSGTYGAVSSDAAPACTMFQAASIELRSVETETSPFVAGKTTEQTVDAPIVGAKEAAQSYAPSVFVILTTTSLLSLLVTFVLGNESLRIPSTAAGLWFLGMVGRTHETTDGRYQRGRLMGYMTANPGCHFRALMAALEMSNGQITHHLRILENEEVIWRRKDGRLVRYYPLTNTMNPAMSEQELPVPPLSPDPNSLQGKILTLLDADGPMGEFPTQAELAKRLEKSQQLVSHHLRTLQKFGLVEKRKMGLKNRYKLTREAIFLLETSDDFIRD